MLEAQLAWWREQLAGAPPALELPTDRPRPAVQTSEREHAVAFPWPTVTARRCGAWRRREGATLFMALLAASRLLLSRYTGQEDVVRRHARRRARPRPEMEGLIGFFVNTLVLRARPRRATPSFRELLGRVRETTLGAYAHQDVPFEKLVEELAPERRPGHTPLFQVMFVAPERAAARS